MNKIKLHLILAVLLVLGNTFIFPRAVFASGAGESFEAEVNGYHISLSFMNEIKPGDNEVHVQIVDSHDQFVIPAELGISVMPVEEKGHEATESQDSHGAEPPAGHGTDTTSTSAHTEPASGHENMPGMDTESGPATQSSHDMGTGSHAEFGMVMLEPEMHDSEYKGVINFDQAGEWNLIVHFTVEDELLEVDFPLNVAGTISKYGVLAGIFGLNVAIVSTAAILKRNAAKKSV
jgi:hypothetical protein